MGCEFEMIETYSDKDRNTHVKNVCLGNMLPCLVDTPMGWGSCTRRTWLLMQANKPSVPPKRRLTTKPQPGQVKLV
jgi:hypothetical protein